VIITSIPFSRRRVGLLRVLDPVPRAEAHVRHRDAAGQLDHHQRLRAPRPLLGLRSASMKSGRGGAVIAGLPDLSWYNVAKRGKIYQITIKYTERSQNIPNVRK
jgi:hypothetical protein